MTEREVINVMMVFLSYQPSHIINVMMKILQMEVGDIASKKFWEKLGVRNERFFSRRRMELELN